MNLPRYLSLSAPLVRGNLFPPVAAALLLLLSQYHFLPFHAAAEFLSIGVAWAMLAVMWHSYDYARNHLLMFLSIGFFWLGGIDLVHTLAYKGMGVFPDGGVSLAPQLWISARLLEALLLLIAPALIQRPVRRLPLFIGMGALASLAVAAALAGLLPATFVEGQGLTPFKVYAEYLIVALLGLAALHFHRRRAGIDPGLFKAILLLLAFTIVSELAFTFYVDLYGISNLIGHIFKLFAFWVLYAAVVNYPLREITTAAREQERISERLRASEARFRQLVENLPLGVTVMDRDFRIQYANPALERLFRVGRGHFQGQTCYRAYEQRDAPCAHCPGARALADHGTHDVETRGVREDGSVMHVHNRAVVHRNDRGEAIGFIEIVEDITDRKQAQEKEREQIEELRRWQGVMLDREERMLALKGEVNALLARLGESPRYAGAETAGDNAGPGPLSVR
jgi:PAS domain S-box-containing protein